MEGSDLDKAQYRAIALREFLALPENMISEYLNKAENEAKKARQRSKG